MAHVRIGQRMKAFTFKGSVTGERRGLQPFPSLRVAVGQLVIQSYQQAFEVVERQPEESDEFQSRGKAELLDRCLGRPVNRSRQNQLGVQARWAVFEDQVEFGVRRR